MRGFMIFTGGAFASAHFDDHESFDDWLDESHEDFSDESYAHKAFRDAKRHFSKVHAHGGHHEGHHSPTTMSLRRGSSAHERLHEKNAHKSSHKEPDYRTERAVNDALARYHLYAPRVHHLDQRGEYSDPIAESSSSFFGSFLSSLIPAVLVAAVVSAVANIEGLFWLNVSVATQEGSFLPQVSIRTDANYDSVTDSATDAPTDVV
jgi:hypothetical protein